LRKLRRSFVAELGPRREVEERALAHKLLDKLAPKAPCVVSSYLATDNEINLDVFNKGWLELGRSLAYPAIEQRGETLQMIFRQVDADSQLLSVPSYGIMQPNEDCPEVAPELILTPLVACSRNGARLGQGGGFYDRIFARFPNAQRIGIAWPCQIFDPLPMESHDVSLHAVVTPQEWIAV